MHASLLAVGALLLGLGSPVAVSAATDTPTAATAALSLDALATLKDRVRLRNLPASVALVRDHRGGHQRHPEAIRELIEQASRLYPDAVGRLVGLYPDDPEAVGAEQARWSLAWVLRSGDDLQGLAPPAAPLRLEVSPATLAMTLDSTLGSSRQDGLLLAAWLALSGHVQTEPTRLEYLALSGGLAAPVRIVIPVRARALAALP